MSLSAPFRVTWDITNRCNLQCRHCYNASYSGGGTLPPSDLHTIAEALAHSGIFFATLSGGEPLMEPEIWKVISLFRDEKKSVQLISNGTLITEKVARKIKDFNVNSVQISLDGLEETHNNQRGAQNCFKKSVQAIEYLLKENISVVVNTLVSQRNVEEIPSLLKVLLNLGVCEWRVTRMILMGRGQSLQDEILTREQTKTLTLFLLEKRRALQGKMIVSPDECIAFCGEKIHEYGLSWHGCPAGRTECAVDFQGNVYPCVFLTYDAFNMGNLLTSDFNDIWCSSKFADFRRIERRCRCTIADFCQGGCPAAAYGYYGDIKRKDPFCWRDEQ